VIFDELKEQDLPNLIDAFNSVVEEGLYLHRRRTQPYFQPHNRYKHIWLDIIMKEEPSPKH